MAKSSIKVDGIEDIEHILKTLVPKHARNIMKAAIGGVARDAASEIKQNAPAKTGNLKKSIKVKRPRTDPDKPAATVAVEKGLAVKYDGFYWRFVEYGTGGKNPQPARPFVRPARENARKEMQGNIRRQFLLKLAAASKREQKKKAKKAK